MRAASKLKAVLPASACTMTAFTAFKVLMAVKTHFSNENFVKILAAYNLGELQEFEPVMQGAVQTTYILVTTIGKFIFRYYENRSHGSVLFESELIKSLNEHSYPCPVVFSNQQGELVGNYDGKPYLIFEFVEGEHLEYPTDTQKSQLIENVAWLHNLTKNHTSAHREHRWNYSVELCRELAQSQAEKIKTPNSRSKLAWFNHELSGLDLPDTLPKGICHCDFHFSNVLFKNGEFKALIDFDDANHTFLIYDLATLINPFVPSLEWDTWQNFGKDDPVFDFRETRTITLKYAKHRQLTHEEKIHLFDVFKLSIMFDGIWYFGRGDANDFYERRKIEYLNQFGRENFAMNCFDNII